MEARRTIDAAVWTPQLVCQHIEEAYRQLPGRAFVIRRRGSVLQFDDKLTGAALVLSWPDRYVTNAEERHAVINWASILTRSGMDSLREFVRLKGDGSWATFNRRRTRACIRIAEGLNRDKVPWFSLKGGPPPAP
jgi:hypothetical protein